MIVQCPNCETTFSLADELYRAGRKVRCSQCKTVFALPEAGEPQPKADVQASPVVEETGKRGKRQKLILLLAFIVIFVGIGYGGYMVYSLLSGGNDETFDAYAETMGGILPKIEKETLEGIDLENVYQVRVNNKKVGKITVVWGDIVNNSDRPKEMLSVRVFFLDRSHSVLAWQQQIGGIVLSQFQLETLGVQEIKAALNNTLDIVVNNTDVPPGGRVPFQVVFFNAPTPKYIAAVPVMAKDASSPLQNMSGDARSMPPAPVNEAPSGTTPSGVTSPQAMPEAIPAPLPASGPAPVPGPTPSPAPSGTVSP